MKRNLMRTVFCSCAAWLILQAASMSPVRAAEPLQYNRDIRPILADNCFACHGADSAARKADLRLDRRPEALESGAIAAGKPGESELIARIFSDDPDSVMPPPETKKKLTAAQREKLKQWIAAGAEYQTHWSLIAPQKPAPPAVKDQDWVKNAIDFFILAKLQQRGLAPARPAKPRALFRRLHLDITGLPPDPADAAKFEKDYQTRGDAALEEWIDRLMKSPRWGEHRARYWLDAARYGDTHGLHFDNYREMWPYRDWVIRAFNANQRFDQFILEQIAGDMLPEPTLDQRIATGFQRCNITTNEGGTIDEENLALYAADRVQTFGWVFLGLTTNCGQCHDHKFDPFTTRDYYSLAAFFRNTTQGAKDGNVKDGRGPVLAVPSHEDRARWDALTGEIAAAKLKRDQYREKAREAFQAWLASISVEELSEGPDDEALLVHVPLTEGKGQVVSSAGKQPRAFKSTGKVTWIDDGKLGPAAVMKLGGTFDLGELGDFERDQPFSCGAWIRAGRGNVSGGIIARMDEQKDYRGWDLWQQGQALAVHVIDSWPDNGLKVATRGNVLKPGQWQHVLATYDGSGKPGGIKIYVDGKAVPLKTEKDTLKASASIRTKTPLRIGQRSHTQVFAGGAIQDVRLYSRVLAGPQVKVLANLFPLRSFLSTPADKRTPQQQQALFNHYLATQDKQHAKFSKVLTQLESELNAIRRRSPITHVQQEKENSPAMAYILMRGEYDKRGKQVKAATPSALHAMPKDAPANRLGLGRWLIDPANPLTARVTVNRFWQEVFGQGIVVTPEDFGVMGALPSHPELLDWLATEFVASGWDVKAFYKRMLMSSTYRQAAITTPQKRELDRDNVLLSRGPRFRMDAEMVRDFALASSGLLSPKMYGPGVKPYQPEAIWDVVGLPGGNTRNYVQDKGDGLYRRTLYNFWKRMAPPPSLDALNAPSREVCTVRRERTNTPLQALVTLNDPQYVEAARFLAQQALQAGGQDDRQTVNFISQRVLGRDMNRREQDILLADLKEYLAYYESNPKHAKALIAVGESKTDEKFDAAKLAAWAIVCNQAMNLDEALNK